MQFFLKEAAQALDSGAFYWAMKDEKEAQKAYNHPEIGWFNDKTEKFLSKGHGTADAIGFIRWLSKTENLDKYNLSFLEGGHRNHDLPCVEVKVKSMYRDECDLYLKVGMIPVWSEDYSKIIGYYDNGVFDFHDGDRDE